MRLFRRNTHVTLKRQPYDQLVQDALTIRFPPEFEEDNEESTQVTTRAVTYGKL